MTARVRVLLVAALLLAAGCQRNSNLPKTYPVRGKVVFADGTPLSGGLVQFTPENRAEVTTTGAIQEDGSFTLKTLVDAELLTGALEGQHTVTILPPLGQDQRAPKGMPQHSIQLREPVTVKADTSNTFTLTLPQRP
jgi:hypothetical protein